ncbi:MAG: DUF255 domain-containing protein [Deltaproteobacteria bacterium]|nr:DUF255 domain-containing protein [Deltaproteobacteria bacterium]
MKNKSIIALIVAYLILSVCIPCSGAASKNINWYSYDEAKTLSQKNAGKVFLYFYSTSCHYCGLMEKNTFSNSTVAKYLNQNFTSIKVNFLPIIFLLKILKSSASSRATSRQRICLTF